MGGKKFASPKDRVISLEYNELKMRAKSPRGEKKRVGQQEKESLSKSHKKSQTLSNYVRSKKTFKEGKRAFRQTSPWGGRAVTTRQPVKAARGRCSTSKRRIKNRPPYSGVQ